jgi:hypothetical protein
MSDNLHVPNITDGAEHWQIEAENAGRPSELDNPQFLLWHFAVNSRLEVPLHISRDTWLCYARTLRRLLDLELLDGQMRDVLEQLIKLRRMAASRETSRRRSRLNWRLPRATSAELEDLLQSCGPKDRPGADTRPEWTDNQMRDVVEQLIEARTTLKAYGIDSMSVSLLPVSKADT